MLKRALIPNVNQKGYFSREKFLLKIGGTSLMGDETTAYKIYSFFTILLFNFSYPVVVSISLVKQDFNKAVDGLFYVVASIMAILMILVTFRNRVKLGKLLKRLEEEPFIANKERGGEEEEKLINGWLTFSNLQSLTFFVGVVATLSTQMLYSIYIRIKSSDYHDWSFGFGEITILNVTYSPNYEITWLYQNTALCCMALNVCSVTLILAGTLAHISVQFQMLQNNFRRIVDNSYNKMLRDAVGSQSLLRISEIDRMNIPWKYLQESLKEAVLYHLSIMEMSAELERIFSMSMLSVYLCTLALLCLEVYRMSLLPINDARTLRLLVETITASFHSLILCFSGEQMASESEKVARAAYEINFVGTDLRFQKGLSIVMVKNQKPMRIKAGKLIETSMVTFAWILRASYSAFMVVRNFNMQG